MRTGIHQHATGGELASQQCVGAGRPVEDEALADAEAADRAERAGFEQRLEPARAVQVSPQQTDPEREPARIGFPDHRPALLRGHGQRLLHEQMLAGLEQLDPHRTVEDMRHGDDGGIELVGGLAPVGGTDDVAAVPAELAGEQRDPRGRAVDQDRRLPAGASQRRQNVVVDDSSTADDG